MAGTMNWADMYGGPSAAGSAVMGTPAGTSVQVTGPNQSSVSGSGQVGGGVKPSGSGAAFSWVSFAVLLIVMRVALEMGGEVK